MELLRDFFFFVAKYIRKHLCRSLFLIKLQVYILQLHWKKGLQDRCFLMNFARYLKRNTSRRLLLFYEKTFYQKNSKELSQKRKKKKMKTVSKKTTARAEQKLNHNLYQILISFYYSKISLFLFSLLPMTFWKHSF